MAHKQMPLSAQMLGEALRIRVAYSREELGALFLAVAEQYEDYAARVASLEAAAATCAVASADQAMRAAKLVAEGECDD